MDFFQPRRAALRPEPRDSAPQRTAWHDETRDGFPDEEDDDDFDFDFLSG